MKTFKFFLWFLLPFIATSCLQEGYDTIVLNQVSPIDEVVPVEYRLQMEQYMPFYNGDNPPNVEGVYLVSPDVLVYSSIEDDIPGREYMDIKLKFSNQNEKTNILSYEDKQGNSNSISDSVVIMGSDDNFTAYIIATGTSDGIYKKTALVISGTKTSSGIKDYYKGFVMLDKGDDPDDQLIDVGEFRVFNDSDGTASNSNWYKSAIINVDKMKCDDSSN